MRYRVIVIVLSISLGVLVESNSPYPPDVEVAIGFTSPYGYYAIANENGTYIAGYDTELRVRTNANETIVIVDSKTYNVTVGRTRLADSLSQGYHQITVIGNTTTLSITLYVQSVSETVAVRTKSMNVDPYRIKYIYALLAALVASTIGLGIGERIRRHVSGGVEEV